MIALNTNGATSANSAAARIATRKITIVDLYGRAKPQHATKRALPELDALHRVDIARHHRMWTHPHGLTLRARIAVRLGQMSMRRRRVPDARTHHRQTLTTAVAAVVLGVALASCSIARVDSGPKVRPPVTRDVSDVTTTTIEVGGSTTLPTAQPLTYSIAWEAVDDRTDVGTITVPVDYDDPQGATLELKVARHKADPDQRIGVLATNNGGPGCRPRARWRSMRRVGSRPRSPIGSTSCRGILAAPASRARRSIASTTPNTTGSSPSPTSLPTTPPSARRTSTSPGSSPSGASIGSTISPRSGRTTPPAISMRSGRRSASRSSPTSGSVTAANSAVCGRRCSRRPSAPPCSTAPPIRPPTRSSAPRTNGSVSRTSLDTFLAQCSADDDCAFHNDGDAEGAFDALMAQLDASPLPSADGRAPVSRDVAATAVLQSMYSDSYWPALEQALEDAAGGDGAGLLELNDAYYRRAPDGTYTNLIESFQAITCMDQVERETVAESDASAADLVGVAPRLFPYTTGSYSCTFFPPSPDPRVEITGIGAGPIVVIGTTGDPSTPLESSRAMADALEDGRLVIVVANQHTGYRANSCVNDLVEDYLVNLVAPADETTCS